MERKVIGEYFAGMGRVIYIYEIEHGIEDKVIFRWNGEEGVYKSRVRHDLKGRP